MTNVQAKSLPTLLSEIRQLACRNVLEIEAKAMEIYDLGRLDGGDAGYEAAVQDLLT